MNLSLMAEVADTLVAYEARYGMPTGRVDLLRAALEVGRSVTSRNDLPVHVTCGVILRQRDGRVLQIRHRALDRWLFPGGHIEAGDSGLINAARRELVEETGLTTDDAEHPEVAILPLPIDIDVHAIPASEHKGEPEHFHADFRYVAETTSTAVDLQVDEVTDWRWVDPNDLGNTRLAARLRPLAARG